MLVGTHRVGFRTRSRVTTWHSKSASWKCLAQVYRPRKGRARPRTGRGGDGRWGGGVDIQAQSPRSPSCPPPSCPPQPLNKKLSPSQALTLSLLHSETFQISEQDFKALPFPALVSPPPPLTWPFPACPSAHQHSPVVQLLLFRAPCSCFLNLPPLYPLHGSKLLCSSKAQLTASSSRRPPWMSYSPGISVSSAPGG